MRRPGGAVARPRRAELIAALSLGIDLGLGQPMEHMLRSCLIAMRLGDLVGADRDDRETAYYGGLLAWIGCHADSQEFAELFGDDIAFRAASYDVDWRGPEFAALLVRYVGSVRPLPDRAVRLLDFVAHARPQLTSMIASHCVSASALAARLGLPDRVIEGLAFTFERWDGSGLPTAARGEAIPLGMRLVHLADVAEVHLRRGGPDAAITMARKRAGRQFDPHLVDVFCRHVGDLDPGGDDVWDAVIALAPDAAVPLDAAEVDRVLEAMGDFVDLKSPWTVGHSRAVVELAVRAGRSLGLSEPELTDLARAGRVMDLGLMGVPNRVWRKTTVLSPAEEERVRLHPYLTRRILSRVAALEPLGRLASSHHERLDGTGYPQGATAPQLGLPERILAAAEEYRSSREPHPLRPALAPADAARSLRGDVRAGRLDGPAAEAVVAAAENRSAGRPAWPAGLTGREVTVLRGIARGRTAAEVGAELHISPKTARNHIEHIYVKIGASNRTAAALFAVSHGLLGDPE
jgi:HD-GYP domain-containing protein (c-di-GMP phosphodiesterase class II)